MITPYVSHELSSPMVVALIVESTTAILGMISLAVSIHICIRTHSFHSYFRVLLVTILLVLFVFELLVLLNPISEIFPDFATLYDLPWYRKLGQTLTFEVLTIVFLVVCLERTIAVSYCKRYEKLRDVWPIATLLAAIFTFSFMVKYLSDRYELRLVFAMCLFVDTATLIMLVMMWFRNNSLKRRHRGADLTTKYQLSENDRVSRVVFPLVALSLITKGLVAGCIILYRGHPDSPNKMIYFCAYRTVMSCFAILCLPVLALRHGPYRAELSRLVLVASGGRIRIPYPEDAGPTRAESNDHELYFHLLHQQWNDPTSRSS